MNSRFIIAYIVALVPLAACTHTPLKVQLPDLSVPTSQPSTSKLPEVSGPSSCKAAILRAETVLGADGVMNARRQVEELRSNLGGSELELRIKDNVRQPGEEVRVGLRWRLPSPGEQFARKGATQAGLAALKFSEILEKADLAADVRSMHLAVRRTQASMQSAKDLEALSRSALNRERKHLSAGVSTRLRLDTARMQLHRDQLQTNDLQGKHEAGVRLFKELFGLVPSAQPCVYDLRETTLQEHPAIKAAISQAQRSDYSASAEAARGSLWPSFVDAHWAREGEDPGRALVQIGIPLFSNERREAALERARANRDVAKVRRIGQAVKQALIEAKSYLRRKEHALKNAGQIAEDLSKTRKLEDASAGKPATEKDRRELKRARIQLEARLRNLRYDLEEAKIELMRALGRP